MYASTLGSKPFVVRNESDRWDAVITTRLHHRPVPHQPINGGDRVKAFMMGPERWRTIHVQDEARRKPGGGLKRY
jgi:hypothetical protein